MTDQINEHAIYKILIVDDDELLLEMAKCILDQENYHITVYTDPAAALERLKQEFFHVIISDYMMPGMNGGDLLKQVRALHPDCLRILLTANTDVDAVLKAVKDGAVYKFILKPWNNDDFRLNIELALEQYELIIKNKKLEQEQREKSKEIERLSKFNISDRSPLVHFLYKKGLLSISQVHDILGVARDEHYPIIQTIIDHGWLAERTIHNLINKELNIPLINVEDLHIDSTVTALIPSIFCQQKRVIPLELSDKRLIVGMADPLDFSLLEDIRFVTGFEVIPVLVPTSSIQAKVSKVYQLTEIPKVALPESPEIHIRHRENVFILHGVNEARWRELKDILKSQFKLNPVVINEQHEQGFGTAIEKFEHYAGSCGYAIAIFSHEDNVRAEKDRSHFQPEAFAMYQLGWLRGHLGLSSVLVLLEEGISFPEVGGMLQKRFTHHVSEKSNEIKESLVNAGVVENA